MILCADVNTVVNSDPLEPAGINDINENEVRMNNSDIDNDHDLFMLDGERINKQLFHEYREDHLDSIISFARSHDYEFIAAGTFKGK